MRDSSELDRFESDTLESQPNQLDRVEAESRIRDAGSFSDKSDALTNVQPDRIQTENVQSAADFDSPEQYASFRREAEMLKDVQPAVERGATRDDFDEWDRANQIGHHTPNGYVRGYVDVHETYYGKDAIAVEHRPDGSLHALDGQHRIVATRDAGLSTIPVRIEN